MVSMLVLCIDFNLAACLHGDELKAVIAHKYGHFVGDLDFSYRFVRRCLVSSNFFDFEVTKGGDGTIYTSIACAMSIATSHPAG